MSAQEFEALAAKYAHDENVLMLIAENAELRRRIHGLFDRLKLQSENYAQHRQASFRRLAKCHG